MKKDTLKNKDFIQLIHEDPEFKTVWDRAWADKEERNMPWDIFAYVHMALAYENGKLAGKKSK